MAVGGLLFAEPQRMDDIQNITGGHQNASLNYYSYSGEIDVMLDPGDNIMYEGVYKGNMYIHVIGER